MRFIYTISVTCFVFLLGCSPSWSEAPYEVYIIDDAKSLGYSLGNGGYISRIEEPINIASNEAFISVYACPKSVCCLLYTSDAADE